MKKIELGKNISVNLQNLIDTRLLIQANSGGGKSFAIRKLLEETNGKVHQIVLDIEGDFGSLRESFDYILAGKGGDIPADPRSAELLAKKILELQTDLIVDLYELKHHERIRFVKLFLEAMINAPKDLWHPVLLVLDEAHLFAPEKGQAESMNAVIDLCTRGRKRGFCAVLATQRLSKLHKDAAAECNNKLIGRTGLDIDLKRAGDEIGFLSAKDARALRHLNPGQFYAFGPAISSDVILGAIGEVKTTHPKAGARGIEYAPAPTAKVKAALGKLQDLPKEAEQERTDKISLQARIRTLEQEVQAKPKPQIDDQAIERAISRTREQMMDKFDGAMSRVKDHFTASIQNAFKIMTEPELGILVPRSVFEGHQFDAGKYSKSPIQRISGVGVIHKGEPKIFPMDTIGKCERAILGFLKAKQGQSFTKIQIGAMTGYSSDSGNFNNSISSLSKQALISKNGNRFELSPDIDFESLGISESPHRLEDWIAKLGKCEKAIYQEILKDPSNPFDKDELGALTGYSPTSGNFNNSISRLNTLGLIRKVSGGKIELNPEIRGL